jgi:NAD-dependent dihydropyrimidine dehydrogenase PreA subunit
MLYVDENLCTGCGICLEACDRGALSMRGRSAFIDESLCTSCGRCADTCVTGAIVTLEIDPDTLPGIVPAQSPQVRAVSAGMAPLSPARSDAVGSTAASPVPVISPVAKLEMFEKAVSSLLSVVSFFLDRRERLGVRQVSSKSRTPGSPVVACRRRGVGPGQGSARGRGYRGGQRTGRGRGVNVGQGRAVHGRARRRDCSA